nr:hypothetical protein [Tanacetum cinerariifolium]
MTGAPAGFVTIKQDDALACGLQVQCGTDADNTGAENEGLTIHGSILNRLKANVRQSPSRSLPICWRTVLSRRLRSVRLPLPIITPELQMSSPRDPAVPKVEDVGAGFVRADAGGGFAQPAMQAAKALLIEKARTAGIAILAIRNSHHFAALWPDVEPFAQEGLVALSVVNSMTCVVPHDAQKPLFGTNPIAFAAPR